uniref:TIMELESS-interacting protein n=1 Tax=Cuerna arida TaxID=1464854 RepID=A0A1B6EZL7_9HEMI
MLEELYSDNLVDEPDDIEHVIEGEEFERKDPSEHGSGNEEEKNTDEKDKEKQTTKIKRKQGPRIVLNPQRLVGPRGIGVIESFFSDIPEKLQGKGKENEDLNLVMGRLQHWAHRLMPSLQFDDCLKKIESMGNKKEVVNMVKRIRLGMEDENVPDEVLHREEMESPPPDVDPFDELISSSAPTRTTEMEITVEQREQMLRNRLIAEERRAARIKRAQEMKEKFQSQQMAISQSDNFQATPMEFTREDSSNAERRNQISVEKEKNKLDETGSVTMDKNAINVGLANCGNEYEIIQSDEKTDKNEVETELPIEDRTKCKMSTDEKMDELEVPEEVFSVLEKENCRLVKPARNCEQSGVLDERNESQIDVIAEKDGKGRISVVNQPDILAQRDDIQPDILLVREHENNEVSERNETQSSVLDGSQPDVVSININEPHMQEENSLENQPLEVEIENQPVALELDDNQQPDIIPDGVEVQPDIGDRIGSQPDIIMKRSDSHPDILI